MYLHMKCTDSDVLLVLARSRYVHENTEFSLQSFLSKQISLKLPSFCVCDRKPEFAHLGGTSHMQFNDITIPDESYKRDWIWVDQRDLSRLGIGNMSKGSPGTDAIMSAFIYSTITIHSTCHQSNCLFSIEAGEPLVFHFAS